MEKRINYSGLDVLKCIMALLVCLRHMELGNKYFTAVTCCAVPTFFIISGFLYGIKNPQNTANYCYRYISRLFILFVCWSLIYMPLNIRTYIRGGHSLLEMLIDYLQNFIFAGSYWHLWYLPALMLSLIILHLLLKKFHIGQVLGISIVLYVVGVMGDSYCGIIDKYSSVLTKGYEIYRQLFMTTRNGIFYGMLFISIGFILAKKMREQNNILFYKTSKLLILILAGVIGTIFEVFLIEKISGTEIQRLNMLIFTILISVGLVLISLKYNNISDEYTKIFRVLSTLIYTTHVGVIVVVKHFLNSLFSDVFIIVIEIALIIVVSVMVYMISKKVKCLRIMM